MYKNSKSKNFFLLSFGLTLSLGLFFIFLFSYTAWAIDVGVTAQVGTTVNCGNGILEAGETCDGAAGSGNCYNNQCKADCTCPVCGNGTIEVGEACESSANCAAGQTCNSNCACQTIGGCTPGATVCSWGSCLSGIQTGFCSNGCSAWSSSRPCAVPVCGDGQINQPTEECDDNNTISGDGCSATCQTETGCGNGILEAGETCDDNNLTAGDCCSATCQVELLIRNVSVSNITLNSARVNWSTYSWQSNSCQLVETSSVIDWGQGIPPSEGSASLNANTYTHQINGLESNTVYHFLIAVNFGALSATYAGDFTTLRPAEICNNNLDDDNDGLIDTLDPDCPCQPIYDCTAWEPEICPANGVQTRTCTWVNAATCWNSQPEPATSQICTPGQCQISCGVCQSLNQEFCLCENLEPCCGNGVCEAWAQPPENYQNCPADCQLTCVPDWQCTDWGECLNGLQTRNCFDQRACGTNVGRPDEIRACTPGCSVSCPGTCHQVNLEQCICESLVPCCGNQVCEIGESYQSCPQDCIQICFPNWVPSAWGECINGIQVRTYQDLNQCPYVLGPPPDERSCTPGCDVACGLCQKIDLATCSCTAVSPCCGDRICSLDQNENVSICQVDCGLPPDLSVNLPQCLDGVDNDKDGSADYPADVGCNNPFDNSEVNLVEFLTNIIDNPQVEQVNKITAPALVTAVAVNTFATFSFVNFLTYLQFFTSQPIAALFRRKRKKWGIVYNALTKQPIDLAIVRLYQQTNAKLVQSRVTDKLGRYNFLVSPGRYYLTVTKPKYNFPTVFLKNYKEDVKYLDLYHGEVIEIKEDNSYIVYNIPIDPVEETKPATRIILQHYLRKIQKVFSFAAVPLALLSLIISPGVLTLTILVVHCLLFILFYRLGYQKPPKSWGKIFDKINRRPINLAIARIYDKQYNKLLETRVTDALGRYSFLVNNNVYYLTVEKVGFRPYKSNDINLVSKDVDTVVGFDIGLERSAKGESTGSDSKPLNTPPVTPAKVSSETQPVEVKPDATVGRETLQNLLQAKNNQSSEEKPVEPMVPKPNTEEPPLPSPSPEKEKSIFG